MNYNDYVVFIKKNRKDFEPVDSAETKDEGIEIARTYLENPKVVEAEVVYMPVEDYDTEEVVWNSLKDTIQDSTTVEESLKESKQYTTSELISSSLNHFGDLGKIPNLPTGNPEEDWEWEPFVGDVIEDIQNNYDLDYSFEPETKDMKEYARWYDSIEAEIIRQLR